MPFPGYSTKGCSPGHAVAVMGAVAPADPLGEGNTQLISDLGGNSAVIAFYDARKGTTSVSGGLSQWDDVRGDTGFGPSLTQATASARLAISDEGTEDALIALETGDWIATDGAVSGLTLADVKALVFIGVLAIGAGNSYVSFTGASGTPYFRVRGGGNSITVAANDGTNTRVSGSTAATSSTRRVAIATLDGQAIRCWVPDKTPGVQGNLPLLPSQSTDMGIAVNSAALASSSEPAVNSSCRAVLVLGFVPDDAQRAILMAYGTAHHGAVAAANDG